MIEIFTIEDFATIKLEVMKKHKLQIANIVNTLKNMDLQKYNTNKFRMLNKEGIELGDFKYIPVHDDLNDDNSFFSAISILFFGDETYYKHIRLFLVYILLKNENEYIKQLEKEVFEELVIKTVKTGFPFEYHLLSVMYDAAANLLDRTVKVYKWENYTELPEVYATNNITKDPLIIAKKENHFIPLLKKDI